MPDPVVEQQPDAGLAALQAELGRNKAEVARLTAEVNKKPVVVPAPVNQLAPPTKESVEQMFWKDPLPMVQAISQRAAFEATQQVQQTVGPTMRQNAKDKVRGKDPDTFDQYEVEIEAAVASVQEQFQGNINVWENAFNIVKGQHVDEILEAKNKKKEKEDVKIAADGPGSPSPKAATAPKETPLNGEQKEVARGIGLSDEEYRRGQKRLENQQWPVTFSSEEKRRAAINAKRKAS